MSGGVSSGLASGQSPDDGRCVGELLHTVAEGATMTIEGERWQVETRLASGSGDLADVLISRIIGSDACVEGIAVRAFQVRDLVRWSDEGRVDAVRHGYGSESAPGCNAGPGARAFNDASDLNSFGAYANPAFKGAVERVFRQLNSVCSANRSANDRTRLEIEGGNAARASI